jgi:hypothetical protein
MEGRRTRERGKRMTEWKRGSRRIMKRRMRKMIRRRRIRMLVIALQAGPM